MGHANRPPPKKLKVAPYIQALLDDANLVITSGGVTWEIAPTPSDLPDKTARIYSGKGNEWVITVVSFDIENQGFPPGSRGYDAVGRKDTDILHLTREIAEKAFLLAEKACGK